MKKAALAFAVLLLAATLRAGPGCTATPTGYIEVCGIGAFDSCYGTSEFIGMVFMLVSLCIALAYMYSQFRHDPQMGVWAKDEAANLAISVLLFAGLIAFFTGSCTIASEYSKNATLNANPFTASQNYIDALLSSNGRDMLYRLTADSLQDQEKGTFYAYYGLTPFYGTGAASKAGWKAFSAHKEFVLDLYLPMIASLNAQKFILQAIQWIGASLLLPFAFVMRLFPPTREFGNVMIAVFFGAYIVVPAMYAMSGAAFEKITSCTACRMSSANAFYSYGIDGKVDGNPQDAVLYKIGSTIPQAVFLPNLVLIVAITCIMALSKALKAISV